ncbi:M20/M25/M40 family metallo-hydrolase [Gemmatimonas aurantiaca]|uniref:M20/M25/M40 family metallo-hydrolase n=1 Tax=Gemmatimonas aurantiaca TaxID=173480 RepID=UPI0012E9ED6E|nr:M20/M25/M40 family metallo-hydrolase [Gemmatimonas aurantiaca]
MSRVLLATVLLTVTTGAASAALPAQNSPTRATSVPSKGTPTKSARPVWSDEGPAKWAPRPTESAITANDLRTRLYQFADDSMSGRRIGERGNWVGTEYIAREFKRMGLKPAGDSGTYFQTLPFGPIGIDSSSATLTVGGKALTQRSQWVPTVPSAANGVGSSVSIQNVPAVFAGQWGDTTVMLDAAAMRGKVLVFTASPAMRAVAASSGAPASFVSCMDVPDKFGANAAIAEEARQRANPSAPPARRPAIATAVRDARAQAAGAAAVLIIGLDDMQQTAINAAFAQPMGMRPASPLNAAAPAGASISRAVAEQLFGKPIDQVAVGTTGQPVTASWQHRWRVSPHPARNVVAVLPGSDPTIGAEYVLVGAHNDHVGVNPVVVDHDSVRAYNTVVRRQGANDPVCTPSPEQQKKIDSLIAHARSIRAPRRDSIMNGADDDGSGTVVLLEIAEKFAKEKPKRSIIFVSHQGEEGGLLGSRWFTDNPTIPLDKIVAAHNMDMVGKGKNWQVKYGGPNSVQMLGARRLSREFGDMIDSVNSNSKEPMAIDKSWDVPANPLNRFCRSDQVNYVRKDIPTVYMSLGYAIDYHQHTDEPQYIDYDHSARLGRFVHEVMTAIANRPNKPAIAGPDPTMPTCGR